VKSRTTEKFAVDQRSACTAQKSLHTPSGLVLGEGDEFADGPTAVFGEA
jgi:hypothetical protein